jgi:chemotaxis protein CheY-P-specific phosphatase CheC
VYEVFIVSIENLQQALDDAKVALLAEIADIKGSIGDISTLETVDKGSIVDAINELAPDPLPT